MKSICAGDIIKSLASLSLGALSLESKRSPKRFGYIYADSPTTVHVRDQQIDNRKAQVSYYGSVEALLKEWRISERSFA